MCTLQIFKNKSMTVCVCVCLSTLNFPSMYLLSLSLLDLTPPCRIFSLEEVRRMLLTGTQRAETSWRTVMIVVLLSLMILHYLCWVQVRLNRQADHRSQFEWSLGPSSSSVVHKDNEILLNPVDLLIELN